MAFNWNCPHCNLQQTVTEKRYSLKRAHLGLDSQNEGHLFIEYKAIGCANPGCQKSTIHVRIGNRPTNSNADRLDEKTLIFDQRLVPQGLAKPQPNYIPQAIRDDYQEACLIAELSPKASATLTRRCLQGMIRDFAKISKNRLIDEIKALRKAVDDGSADRSISIESVDAIDHVRGIGNIGAHMERDIDHIIEVDPGEAQALIELVEMLFDEWYGAKHRRENRLAKISGIAADKSSTKTGLQQAAGEGDEAAASAATQAILDDTQ